MEGLARRAAERMLELQREADALATQERTLLVELRKLEVERQLKAEELTRIGAQAALTARELADTIEKTRHLDEQAETQRSGIRTRLVELYKLGRARYARLLFGVQDLRAIGRAYRLVAAMAQLDRQRVDEHRRTLEALKAARLTLEARHVEMGRLTEQATRAQQALERTAAARTKLVRSIDERRDVNAQLAGELQQAQQKLQLALAAVTTGRADAVEQITLPLGPFRGVLDWPVAGVVSNRFGPQRNKRFGTTIMRNGIEIAATENLPVRAVHDGRVAFADVFTGFGNLVILDHGDEAYSLYGYLSNTAVKQGTYIDRRTIVGAVGRAPTGPSALYFELRIDGKPVDPIEWLKRNTSRR